MSKDLNPGPQGGSTRSENTHLLLKGKHHCMADLLFDWFGFSYQQINLFGKIQTSQTGGQPYNYTSPY